MQTLSNINKIYMAGKVRYKNRWMTHDEVRKLKNEETPQVSTAIPSLSSITEVKNEEVVEVPQKDLETLREEFQVKFGQSVSNRYKNDSDWIIQKLNS